jgi:hypothetical protein
MRRHRLPQVELDGAGKPDELSETPLAPGQIRHRAPQGAGSEGGDSFLDKCLVLLVETKRGQVRDGLFEDVRDERGKVSARHVLFGEEGREDEVDGVLVGALLLPVPVSDDLLCELAGLVLRDDDLHASSFPRRACASGEPDPSSPRGQGRNPWRGRPMSTRSPHPPTSCQ